ncbi:putative NAD-specific glutamate dehydrogenase [Mesorhizobium alhagi CCNWXJ12-2]|uniref:Putative NAD-specific glutamate dehydrogenase n=1 Tax=Mesorhizobium alhagi CCNWXJ12-2 TaxID=1107882 RepID=H0HKQ8_9HYPH|nr:putative NAD-specific glutamate dehydrogenase [Mesorhizobium alhagi CCNWXJ12-2]
MTEKGPASAPGLFRQLISTHSRRLLLVVVLVDFLEIRVDHVRAVLGGVGCGVSLGGFLLRGLVHGLAELHRDFGKALALGVDVVDIIALGRGLQRGDRIGDGGAVGFRDLVAIFLQRLLGRMHQSFGLVAGLDQRAALLVALGVGFGVLDHLFDVVVGQAARGLDADLVLLAGALVLGRDIDDAVGVDIEGDLDLRHAARRRRNTNQIELAERLVVGCHFTLALEDPDRDGRLGILGGRENLALLGRDGGVAFDQAREHAAERLDAERQRRHVEQQHVLDVALQHAGLDRSAERHHLIRVDALVRLLAEELLHHFLDFRHARHAADQNHLVDLACLQASILQRRLAGLDRALDEIIHQRLELGAGQLHRQVLRARLIGRDERQVDLGLRGRRQLDLGLFSGLLQALQRELVVLEIDALFLLELGRQILDEAHVEILAAEEGVAIGRLHLEDAVADLEHGNVEGAAAKIIDGDGLAFLLVEAVGERGRGRLVDDAQHFQSGDLAGILGGLTLGVVEIGGNGDDGLRDLLAKIGLGGFLHLLEDHGRDLRRRLLLGAGLYPGVAIVTLHDLVGDELLVLLGHRIVVAAADEALDRKNGVFGIGHRLALGRLADEALVAVGECDDGGRGARAFSVLDDLCILAVHDGDAGIGRSQIDTDYFSHFFLSAKQAVRTRERRSRDSPCSHDFRPAGRVCGEPNECGAYIRTALSRRKRPAENCG